MSIYDKPISAIKPDDLKELLSEEAVENLRLEFKSQEPDRDQTLKKLSSFANTYGGYLIVGAEEDNGGKIKGLPGVDLVSGYKQKLVQWCQAHISPPVQVFVSDPIPSPDNSNKMCYVIYVEESIEAPHFINSRKGAYVRTDEFSNRFKPQLATQNELLHLQNRRQLTVERRLRLFQRANDRFTHFIQNKDKIETIEYEKKTGAALKLFLCPRFPSQSLFPQQELLNLAGNIRTKSGGAIFPCTTPSSQHESAVFLNAANDLSYFEFSVWGHLLYAIEIEKTVHSGQMVGIHLNSFVGNLLLFLRHSQTIYRTIGFDGTIKIQVNLENIRNVPWIYFVYGSPEKGPFSELDDSVEFSLDTNSTQLEADLDSLAKSILQTILFALNWSKVASIENEVEKFIKLGYQYNNWNEKTSRRLSQNS